MFWGGISGPNKIVGRIYCCQRTLTEYLVQKQIEEEIIPSMNYH